MADPLTGLPLGTVPRVGSTVAAVAGFDLTFSPAKSISTIWALADDDTRKVIYACHRKAIEFVLAYAEREIFHSRSGTNGIVQEDVEGVIATAFTHWDNRAGDPQLHDHVVVWNRARSCSDGQWRTLDSRGLYKSVVALSEMQQGVLSDNLTQALGVGWEARARRHSERPRWEVTGVPEALLTEFSQRNEQVEAHKDRMVADFVSAMGRQPTPTEVMDMRRRATILTRPEKSIELWLP
jgi:conjugative relaxase-like TrwC/TraI family protein